MQVSLKPGLPERKLVAVLGQKGGIFLPRGEGECIYLADNGTAVIDPQPLGLIAQGTGRTPVYEGDSVTLKF